MKRIRVNRPAKMRHETPSRTVWWLDKRPANRRPSSLNENSENESSLTSRTEQLLKVVTVNLKSLLDKNCMIMVANCILYRDFDRPCLTETWLTCQFSDVNLYLPMSQISRNDEQSNLNTWKKGVLKTWQKHDFLQLQLISDERIAYSTIFCYWEPKTTFAWSTTRRASRRKNFIQKQM